MLLGALESTLKEIEETGGWRGGVFRTLYAEHPESDFIERIHNKDATALSEFQQIVDCITDVDTLSNLRWYPVQTRFADYRKTHRTAINKYNKIIDTRISELRAENAGGRNIGFEIREYSLQEMREMFDSLNSNKELSLLADKVFATAEQFGIVASGAKKLTHKQTAGVSYGSHVQFRESYMNSPEYTDQRKASTILHEYLHAGTVYAIALYEDPHLRYKLSPEMQSAVQTLESIYAEIKRDDDFKGTYGVTNVKEMVAELANEEFREKLEKKNLFRRIVDAVKKLFGIKSDTAFAGVSGAVEYILENSSAELHQNYARSMGYGHGSNTLYSISSTTDSRGRHLTPEQQEFFQDSKVRDDKGRLKVVYHGTDADFTVFDLEKGEVGFWGKGFYFTDKRATGKGYGSRVEAVHLNLENPFPATQEDAGKLNREDLIEQGYDGVTLLAGINERYYIAFYPEQIKRVNNEAPTKNPDIRFSISSSTDNQGNYLTPEQQAFFEDSKMRDADGNLKVYYHGTTSEFNEFKVQRKNTTTLHAFFFTESKSEADTFGTNRGGKTVAVYLNITNPFVASGDNLTLLDKWMQACFPNVNWQQEHLCTEKFKDFLYGKGYDGIETEGMVIVYESNKIKRVDNKKPTTKNDIRFSISPTTGYEEGSIQDRVLTLLRTGTVEDAVDLLQQWAADIEDGKTTANEGETALRDALLTKRPVNAQEAAQKRAELDELIKRYGRLAPGEKPARAVFMPRETVEGRKVSKYSRTVAEAPQTPRWFVAEVERAVANGNAGFTYNVATNKAAMDYVERRKGFGFETNLKEWERIVDTGKGTGSLSRITKEDIALGEFLYSEAVKAGDVATATRLVAELSAIGTQAGQVVQAMSLLKRLSPSGQIYYLQKAVDRINRDAEKQIARGKQSEVTIDPELAKAVFEAENTEDMQAAMDALLQDIANQVPVTFMDKWNTWRYFAMLGNPRTHIRNLSSNVIFAPVTWLKDVVGATVETGAQAVGLIKAEDRTKHLGQAFAHIGFDLTLGKVKPNKYTEFAANDYSDMEDTLRGGGKYNPSDLIRDKRPIFKSIATRWINKLSDLNSKALDAEDAIFLKRAYVNALSQYLAAHKANVDTLENTAEGRDLLAKARSYAVLEAQKATFRDLSALASALSKLQNSGIAGQVIVGGIVPFKKTPINVLKRGVEYSPLGLAKSLSVNFIQLAQGKKTTSECIDGISAGLSGTGIMMLGVYLASQGLLRAGAGDDEKEGQFEELQGAQKYSIVIGDVSYTIDWMAPAALPLFIGCEVYDTFSKDKELSFSDFADTLLLVAEPMFSLSMLDGLNTTLSTAGYSDNPLSAVISSVATGYIGQAVPTLLGQIARSIDGTRRTTYVDKNSDVPDVLSRFVQSNVLSKIPFLSQDLTPKLDAWGRTDTVNNKLLGALENFLSPGYVNKMKTSAMEDELQRLYTATGDASVLPKSAPKYFNADKVRYDLSSEEWVTYQTEMGQGAYEMLTELVNSRAYQGLTDAQKVKAVADVYTYANEKAKAAAVPQYVSTTSWIGKADALTKKGLSVEDYIVQSIVGEETAGQNTLDVLQMDWLSDNDRALLISSAYAKSLTNGNTFTDPFRSGFAYTMTETQTQEYLSYFDTLWAEEYTKLIGKSRYQRANDNEKAEMLDELKSEVATKTKKWMARQLRSAGVRSTKKE